MIKLDLKQITLKNFKGIVDKTIPFKHITDIRGENGTGKTTIFDAFTWLLFDKDSEDRKDFDIKPLDSDNTVVHGVETSVSGIFLINSREKEFKKTYREKHEKKRGSAETVFTGHETLYYINDVPMKQSEYKQEVSYLIDETMFKLITNPLYFSQTMKWQERRKIITDLDGNITNENVLNYDSDLRPLADQLIDMDVDMLKKSLSARRRKLNDDIKAIPYRIDECNNSIKEIDFNALTLSLKEKQTRVENIDQQIMSSSKVDSKAAEKRNKLNQIRTSISRIERDYEGKRRESENLISREISNKEYEVKDLDRTIQANDKARLNLFREKESLEPKVIDLRKAWTVENDKPFVIDADFTCPTCKRPLDQGVVEQKTREMKENFNLAKVKELEAITKKGKDVAARIKAIEADVLTLEEDTLKAVHKKDVISAEISRLKAELEELKNMPVEYGNEWNRLINEASELENELDRPVDTKNQFMEIAEEKKTLQKEIDQLKAELRQEQVNVQMGDRIEELQTQERQLAQQIAELEKNEFLCDKFIKTRVELLESSINSKFQFVRFKLFDTQINGGLTETCEPLINGVPFSSANNASKYNAGIDIINALSEHYQVSAPIFIDNREGINELIPTNAQIVNLIVTKDKSLIVE